MFVFVLRTTVAILLLAALALALLGLIIGKPESALDLSVANATGIAIPPARPASGRAREGVALPSIDRQDRLFVLLDKATASSDYAVQLFAADTLGCLGSSALPRLDALLSAPEADVRAAAVLALHRHQSPAATSLLRSVEQDETEDLTVRILAARALALPSPPCR